MRSSAIRIGIMALALSAMWGCRGQSDQPQVEFTIPPGASFAEVTDTLVARDLVAHPLPFRLLARARGDDRSVRAGRYKVSGDIEWQTLLTHLVEGRVETVPLTIPEGFTLAQMVPRLAAVLELDPEEVREQLEEYAQDEERWDVPGPGLEGYLFPDTYHFAPGSSLSAVVKAMTNQYLSFWTPERVARAEELEMSRKEVTTLASIIQAEARRGDEMPRISGVFHNRLRIGYLLQADATVQYALGERRSRLLYADIEAVADHPYNTYTQPGLPPGPIGAPGEDALHAALNPEETDFLYFVARPDGSHIFTRTLAEHNRARVEARRLWTEAQQRLNGGPDD